MSSSSTASDQWAIDQLRVQFGSNDGTTVEKHKHKVPPERDSTCIADWLSCQICPVHIEIVIGCEKHGKTSLNVPLQSRRELAMRLSTVFTIHKLVKCGETHTQVDPNLCFIDILSFKERNPTKNVEYKVSYKQEKDGTYSTWAIRVVVDPTSGKFTKAINDSSDEESSGEDEENDENLTSFSSFDES